MKTLIPILAAASALLLVAACNGVSASSDTLGVSFEASTPSTRTLFAEPEGDLYPVLWTGEEMVAVSLNGEPPVSARVSPSKDSKRAGFKLSFTPSGEQSYSFSALCPASAYDADAGWILPSSQTPLSGSPDPSAMVISASAGPFDALPSEVRLSFSHLSAYGCVSLKNFPAELNSLDIVWQTGDTLRLAVNAPEQIWFATVPRSPRSMEIIARTPSGSFKRTINLPEDKVFEAGRIARFNVDMTDAAFTPASKSISILAIGNSFSIDGMQYLHGYLTQLGYEDVFLGNLYIGGCSLETHEFNLSNNTASYTFYTNTSGSWKSTSGAVSSDAIRSRNWDIITLQQVSGLSGMPDSYEPYLSSIVSSVKALCPDAKLLWHQTWAYQANSSHSSFSNYGCVQIRMYNSIVSTYNAKIPGKGFESLIPSGTAIQNLRTSFLGDNLTRDGYHLSYAAGRMTAALMGARQISGAPVSKVSLSSEGYSVSSEAEAAIKDAVEKAWEYPLKVSASAYPAQRAKHVSDQELLSVFESAGYDPASYEEMEYDITAYAYYNSTSSSKLVSRDGGSSASNLDQFAASGYFSEEDLPVGTVLVLKKGYQYRPEFTDPYKEKKVLRAETSKVLEGNRRLWWCGDEGKSSDPRSQTEDLGDNQMRANEYGIKNLKRVVENLEKWTAQPDGQYDDLNTMHRATRAQFQKYVNHIQRYIGGKYVNNAPGQPVHAYLPRQVQQEALQWLGRHVLEAPMWLYPESIVTKLGLDATDEIRNRQQTLVAMLTSQGLMYNLHEASLRSKDPYPLADYLNDVFALVWKPLNNKDERENDFRRQQQRSYVLFLGNILNPNTQDKGSFNITAQRSDIVLYVDQHLDQVADYLKAQQATGINGRHYQNLLLQIKKIREKFESGK